jgi:hypothetical protein
MSPRAAPGSGRAAVIGVPEFPDAVGQAAVIRRVATMAPRASLRAGAASAGGIRGLCHDQRRSERERGSDAEQEMGSFHGDLLRCFGFAMSFRSALIAPSWK